MADPKKAIVIVLDVGESMACDSKKGPSSLNEAKKCITRILQQKIFSESKDEIALVLCGTTETSNRLAVTDATEYSHITVARQLQPASWDFLEYVYDIEGSETSADFIDALVIAMDILHSETKARNDSPQRILLISDFNSAFCSDQLKAICNNLKNEKMELLVIGPNKISCDDFGASDLTTTKTKFQIKAEKAVKELLNAADGDSYSFNEVYADLIYYQKRAVKSTPWNASLDIFGNLIPISAYTKVEASKIKPWKNAVSHRLDAKITKETIYQLNDEAKTEVSKDDTIPAYRFGTTLVPFSTDDKVNMDYKSGERGMKVLHFTKEENIPRYHYISDKTMYVFGQKNNETAGINLSSFIQALYETKTTAIVRYVSVNNSAPKMGFLSPRIKLKYECLVFIALPFKEDFRHFVLAPLDTRPANLPTDEQLLAIDNLITDMDLSTAAIDEDGNKCEHLKSNNTVNPHFQRMCQCLQHRVFNPDAPLPEISAHIRSVIEPLPEMLQNARPALKNIKRLFPLREGPKKRAQYNKYHLFSSGTGENDTSKRPLIKNEVSDRIAEVVDDEVKEVGTVNPVKDFNHLMDCKQEDNWFEEVCKQLEKVIVRLLGDFMITKQEDKILSCLSAFRSSSIERKQPSLFNDFIRSLKNTLISKCKNVWEEVVEKKLGLITSDECVHSAISLREASEFIAVLPEKNAMEIDEDEDADDLLDEL